MTESSQISRLREILSDPVFSESLHALSRFNTLDDLQSSLQYHGISLDTCSPSEVLRIVHDFLTSISDDDLQAAAGGEVKFAAIAVGVGTTAVVLSGVAVAGVVLEGVRDSRV